MGVCCAKEEDTVAPLEEQNNFKPSPLSTQGTMQQSMVGGSKSVVAQNLMETQRRLTVEERNSQAEHFLSFKTQRAFKKVDKFTDHYVVRKELGSGAFGSVKLGQHKKSKVPCAIKVILKSSLKVANVYQELNRNELAVLEETQHPHITRVFELMEDNRCFYIIMELITGGNLFDMIKSMRVFSENQAASVIKQLCLALNYMHGLNIMHRDLKPENLMCEKSPTTGEITIKLTDFGFATHFQSDRPETLSLGSPLYMAPELCAEKAYDNKVDVWATGVITFVLLSGMAPFAGRSKAEIYGSVANKEPDYKRINGASPAAKEFIAACLKKNPAQRPTMDQVLQMDWMKNFSMSDGLTSDDQLNISANLAAFSKTTTFQSGICSLISNLQTKAEELNEVRQMFLKLDKNNDGHLTFDELQQGYAELGQIFNMSEVDVHQMLVAADSNGDGKLDYTEFIAAAYRKDLLLSTNNLRNAFQMLDLNGDGSISKDELKQVFGGGAVSQRGEQVWDEIMAEVDKNNDGEISYQEFSDAMKEVLSQRATFAEQATRRN